MATLQEFLDFYQEQYLSVYSELVGWLSDKPAQVLIEIENLNTHLINYLNPGHIARQDNLDKAYNHLVRLTIDCHKLLWVQMAKKIIEMKRTPGIYEALSVSQAQFISAIVLFKRISVAARAIEMKHIGADSLKCLDAYSKAIYFGWSIVEQLDPSKLPIPLQEDIPPDDYICPHTPETRSFEEEYDNFLGEVIKIEESIS